MRVYQIDPGKDLNKCCESKIENIIPWIEEAEIGEEIKIKIIYMTYDEYNNLIEYEGP